MQDLEDNPKDYREVHMGLGITQFLPARVDTDGKFKGSNFIVGRNYQTCKEAGVGIPK